MLEHGRKILARERALNFGDFLRGTACDDAAATVTAGRTEVDDVIGDFDDVEVVFDDDDGVPVIDDRLQNVDESSDVIGVQTGGRFVEDIKRFPRGTALQFGGQFDALGLTAGEFRRGLAKLHIA